MLASNLICFFICFENIVAFLAFPPLSLILMILLHLYYESILEFNLQEHPINQLPLYFGLRFSAKALNPYRLSAVLKTLS